MEKRGVCSGEGEAPDTTKVASSETAEKSGKCCGGRKCGTDTVSNMAEEAAIPPSRDDK